MARKVLTLCAALLSVTLGMATPAGAQEQSRFGVDASEWSSDTAPVVGVVEPVGGSGQLNGGFVTGERYGVQVAIRAQQRFVGPLAVVRSKNTGVYEATTGVSDTSGRATWNYDLHVDLRAAQGVAAGKTLGDYNLVLDSDIGSFFGFPFPFELTQDPNLANVVLWQTSLNPKFGNAAFNALTEDTYSFTLTLTPKTFNGPPITTRMRVVVANP